MPLRIALGLGITVVMFAIAGRRFFWLFRLISAGQPAVPSRFKDVPKRVKAPLADRVGNFGPSVHAGKRGPDASARN